MYLADLHIHSKYSRATSRDCIPQELDRWARRKGIALIGTGDFTHPAWRAQLSELLIPAEEGLYQLKPEFSLSDPAAAHSPPARFVITGEISSIYKKNGRVCKVHNVIMLPSLSAAEQLSQKLEAIGNIHSDGRPILGLDCHDLLEITLETCPDAIFVPAHIWTPHFSLFGAFSGFDAIEECFEDLTPYIHALETGLSSDPPMNWQVSALDRFHLISNSDAHSPQKLGREANLLDTALSYPALAHALEAGTAGGLAGTIEFFPEEGKYHFDGHRACKCCLSPAQADAFGGRCPHCGKKLTIGVQHRVQQLSDRPEGYLPPNAPYFERLVPLPEVISSSLGLSPAKAMQKYTQLLTALGPEFYILRECPLEQIEQESGPCIAEGIRRLRAGKVRRSPGYDGEYGVISLLTPEERAAFSGQTCLFWCEAAEPETAAGHPDQPVPATQPPAVPAAPALSVQPAAKDPLDLLNPQQRLAACSGSAVTAVIAGPGSGKTQTLAARVFWLLSQGVKPSEITAVTFTNQAAKELRARLAAQCGKKHRIQSMQIGTFHSICLSLLRDALPDKFFLLDEPAALELAASVIARHRLSCAPKDFLREISLYQNGAVPALPSLPEQAYQDYCALLEQMGALDFDSLLQKACDLFSRPNTRNPRYFTHLLVDEFQDINPLQYRLLQAWNWEGKTLFAIGDPDQAIYGFRGSDAACFDRLQTDFPDMQTVRLTQNYRSTPEILQSALLMLSDGDPHARTLIAQAPHGEKVRLVSAASERSEAIFVAKEIAKMAGGIDMLSAKNREGQARSFSEIAVLYRTRRQSELLESCLRQEGIPCLVTGRDPLLSDPVVCGMLGFFQCLLSPTDLPALRRCLKAVWDCPGDLCDTFCAAWEGGHGDLAMLAAEFADAPHLHPFLEQAQSFLPQLSSQTSRELLARFAAVNGLSDKKAVEGLLQMAVFYDSLPAFLQILALGQERDLMRSAGQKQYASGAVTLLTLHGAKGLEFPVVFLCGASRGIIPLESKSHPTNPDEERRLLYVGMTRAKEELVLVHAKDAPSPFLAHIPEPLLMHEDAVRKPVFSGQQLSLFG